jgi:hypothetical protein
MRATGGRTSVFLFTKPGTRGTQRKTLGAWPKFNEKAARKATVAAGEVVIGVDPRRQVMAAVDRIAKTDKRGAAKDLRKHTLLEGRDLSERACRSISGMNESCSPATARKSAELGGVDSSL